MKYRPTELCSGNGINQNHLSFIEQHCKFLLLPLLLSYLAITRVRLVLRRLQLASQLRQFPVKRAFRHSLQLQKSISTCILQTLRYQDVRVKPFEAPYHTETLYRTKMPPNGD